MHLLLLANIVTNVLGDSTFEAITLPAMLLCRCEQRGVPWRRRRQSYFDSDSRSGQNMSWNMSEALLPDILDLAGFPGLNIRSNMVETVETLGS